MYLSTFITRVSSPLPMTLLFGASQNSVRNRMQMNSNKHLLLNDICKISGISIFLQASALRAGPASTLILCLASGNWHLSSEIISRPLIGQKYECYVVIEVIEVDELQKGKIAGKQEKNESLS